MTSLLTNVPIPVSDPIASPRRPRFKEGADPQEGKITQPWVDYFTHQGAVMNLTLQRVTTVSLTAQNASISATDFSGGNLAAGLYRALWYARVTQAAGVSSSLTVTVDWTDEGQAVSFSGAAMTGNTVTTLQASGVGLFYSDGASPIRYSTTYVSNAAGAMRYKLSLTLEAMGA